VSVCHRQTLEKRQRTRRIASLEDTLWSAHQALMGTPGNHPKPLLGPCIAQGTQATFVSAKDPKAAQRLDTMYDSVSF
jgi:hypothetical protein